jgi:hypothetical protein
VKKILSVMLLLVIIGIPGNSDSHLSEKQYSLAEQGLEQIIPKLTGHINTLDYIATDLENLASKMKDEFETCRVWVALEIIGHQSMRAWYNRLLLQNTSSIKDAVNLGQMATILRFSKEPLSNGIHRLNRIYGQTKAKEQLQLYESARYSMYSMITVYDKAIAAIEAAIAEGNRSPKNE